MRAPRQLMKTTKWLTLVAMCWLAGGCESLQFYHQAALGQLALLRQSNAVDTLVQDPATTPRLRERLVMVQAMRDFAEQQLLLPVGDRYRRFVQLPRDYVVWNVFAAPPLDMRSELWCYPLIGCAPYRGYFAKGDADALAKRYAEQGFDSYVGGVSAYSTLGWFNDPLLSSFIFYSEPALANLLFHELAHSKVWVAGDVAFNESFASFVGIQGARRWLARNQRELGAEQLARWQRRQHEWQRFKTFALAAKADLTNLYQQQSGNSEQRLQQRERVRSYWQSCYRQQRQQLGNGRFDGFMGERFNNAFLLSLGTYEDWQGAFAQVFAEAAGDWSVFFLQVQALSELSASDRLAQMHKLQQRRLLQQQETQDADHQGAEQVKCQPFADHVLN